MKLRESSPTVMLTIVMLYIFALCLAGGFTWALHLAHHWR